MWYPPATPDGQTVLVKDDNLVVLVL